LEVSEIERIFLERAGSSGISTISSDLKRAGHMIISLYIPGPAFKLRSPVPGNEILPVSFYGPAGRGALIHTVLSSLLGQLLNMQKDNAP
jgi:hypothetical protein